MGKPSSSHGPSKHRPSKNRPSNQKRDPALSPEGPLEVRIIGGRLRRTLLPYSGDPRVRPMKDRVREAVFNLVGVELVGSHVLDLFAGTGALSIEALSRGAVRATLIERHFPTAKLIEAALRRFGLEEVGQVLAGDAFFWGRRLLDADAAAAGLPDGSIPWLVFCCPPYQLFVERREDLKSMLASIVARAPLGSRIVVEFDEHFDPAELVRADEWITRTYLPATIAILRINEPAPAV